SARFIAFIYTPSLLDYFLFSEYCFRTISIAAIFYHFFPFSPLKSCNLFYALLNVTLIHDLLFLFLIYHLNLTIIRDLPFLCLIYRLNRTIIRDLPLLCLIYHLNRTIIRGLPLLCLIYHLIGRLFAIFRFCVCFII